MMDPLMYRQMIGRAGRKGIDSEGESILICTESERDVGMKLLKADLDPIKSCLKPFTGADVPSSLQRAILEVIVTGLVKTVQEVIDYINCTMMAAELTDEDQEAVKAGIAAKVTSYLTELNFVSCRASQTLDSHEYVPTQLGKGVISSSLAPEDGLILLKELCKARKGFVLNCDLHLLYEIIPHSLTKDLPVDTHRIRDILTSSETVPEYEYVADVAKVLNINVSQLYTYGHNLLQDEMPNCKTFKRFYMALALNDLIQEHPLDELVRKYNITKGKLQGLQSTASTFAGMVALFCKELGWNNLEMLISQFKTRLEFGVQRELIDLMRITCVTAQIARFLYKGN